ncbi:uncharacterized protein EI90DRAFT_3114939 [Cantharellus anzutake]|uniref:uncharacterized protein n=1 Tax=Cantharellus anzutake TaxID=1750568 RepID=UPI001908166F|nr:uncharacterized protein EI90DRAFT_3114939 [Cantharellus anzutake]KAF8344192.1 hypothetical protein EI90DRAFT_3114939 [Cantharellus anzutake]
MPQNEGPQDPPTGPLVNLGGLENVTNEAWANFMRNTQNSEATSINGSKKRPSDSSPLPNRAAPSVPKTPPQKPNRILQSVTVEKFVTSINSAWEAATRLKMELSPPTLDESVKKKIEDIYVMFGAPLPKFPDITPLSIALEHATATCKSLAQMNAEGENEGRSVGRFKRDHHQAVPWFFS